ncbi:aminotransferase class I/II-fold pyridoxal phosphate-dependent enzyme [Sulfurimonas sp.]|uniref:threonine aldolase family protein n=1 Tax=Sulfurimonas sp. TaxID=2022749 RepID=UPI0025DF78AB|nr:aminotransferase class I/II-fold pyridoxal phosphate-dependent enzyme [Sulfurimonas sp.]
MNKYSFLDDYSEGCHPDILNKIIETNLIQQTAYGFDEYSNEAKQLIKNKMNNQDSEVFFVTGGTQANLIIASSILRSHEAIISVDIGHILAREAGALEATGHKIISMSSKNGKLDTQIIQTALENHSFAPHMVKPRLVYISNATELGAIYTKKELEEISRFCKENSLYLFLDGARLGAVLCSKYNDLSLEDISKLTDVFTLGATKNGALFGEAIVINNTKLVQDFNINIKQRGALLAKGRILGVQFLELFKENLYFDLAKRANDLAIKLSQGFTSKGYKLLDKNQTNQVFLILPNSLIKHLEKKFSFSIWGKYNERDSIVRLVTSWATDEAKIDELIKSIDLI